MQKLLSFIKPYAIGKDLQNQLKDTSAASLSVKATKEERLVKLVDLYNIFIPTKMSEEIYNTMYFALIRSFERKEQLYNKRQMNENRRVINGAGVVGGINGGDCSLIVGESGIGKTQSITRAAKAITDGTIIELESPYLSIIPVMVVEASPTVSIKGFLFEILRVIDTNLGTDYYRANNRATINTDSLLGAVANALLLHCGVLVIDEIDRLIGNKKSPTFVNVITELLNMCGISVIFVGTLPVLDFFRSTEYLARRSMGRVYQRLEYDDEYKDFCTELFKYQMTFDHADPDAKLLNALHTYSRGTVAYTVQLFVIAQQLALTSDIPKINPECIARAFNERMTIIQIFMAPDENKHRLAKPSVVVDIPENANAVCEQPANSPFGTLIATSSKQYDNAVQILRRSNIAIEEMPV